MIFSSAFPPQSLLCCCCLLVSSKPATAERESPHNHSNSSKYTKLIRSSTMMKLSVTLLLLPALACAWTSSTTSSSHKQSTVSRSGFFKATASAGLASLLIPLQPAHAASETTLPNGVSYQVVQSGKGPKPERGELVAVRFSAYCGDIMIDNIFDTPEPYYTRVGSGGLIKGVEETLPLMQLGDRWKLTIPVRACVYRRPHAN